MQRLIHLLPSDIRCIGSRCTVQIRRCALNAASPQPGRALTDYCAGMGWADGRCSRFIDVDLRRTAVATATVVKDWPTSVSDA